MWGLPPPHPFLKKRHIGRSAEWAGMLPGGDEPCSSPPGSHPWPSFLTRAYGTLPTSLFFSSPNASMLAHVALPSCQTEGGYWAGERGLLSTAQVQCGKNGVFDEVFLFGYIYIYIVIALYYYMLIYLYRYCIVYLLYFWAY